MKTKDIFVRQVKYQQFSHVFSSHLNEKIAKVKGGQAKVGFLASTWANFDVFLVKLQKLAKILENVEKDREFDVFTKNSRQFGDFFRISNLDRQN